MFPSNWESIIGIAGGLCKRRLIRAGTWRMTRISELEWEQAPASASFNTTVSRAVTEFPKSGELDSEFVRRASHLLGSQRNDTEICVAFSSLEWDTMTTRV
jgi:hypothetical protein